MITGLRLQNFRSYSDEAFEFTPGVNIIVGPNASGKTNLLEALLVSARGASYRAQHMDLIARGKGWARLDAQTPTSLRSVRLQATTAPAKQFVIDGRSFLRLGSSKAIPTVVFEPNHLLLLSGAPELRRTYLDDLLEHIEPTYGPLRRSYQRTVAQRNHLLKQYGTAAESQIFPWDVRLGELGASIVSARTSLLGRFNVQASELYSELAGHEVAVRVEYKSRVPLKNYGTSFLHTLHTEFATDSLRGFTGSGPHHDDIDLWLKNQPASRSASRGEMRTAVLMLKVMELRLIEEARGKKPLLLLDDVFSELDGARRQALTRFLQPYQTFITTTDADVVVQHFTQEATIIPLKRAARQR